MCHRAAEKRRLKQQQQQLQSKEVSETIGKPGGGGGVLATDLEPGGGTVANSNPYVSETKSTSRYSSPKTLTGTAATLGAMESMQAASSLRNISGSLSRRRGSKKPPGSTSAYLQKLQQQQGKLK